jgi:hypothetical protein
MKRIILASLLWLAAPTGAFCQSPQFPQTICSGCVIGRLGATTNPPGPSEQIPFNILASQLGLFGFNNLAATGLTVTPAPGTLNQAITTVQNPVGTTSANCTSFTTGVNFPCMNFFSVASDGVNAAAPNDALDYWQFSATCCTSASKGARQMVDFLFNFENPSNSANGNKGYVAASAYMFTNSGDGGTAPTTANGAGSFFGLNPVVVATANATNLFGIAGLETDVQCNGCTTAIRFGESVANLGTAQAAVLANDAAFHVGSGAVGGEWHQALNLSNVNGTKPLDTGGCVICTDATANTIATGMDLSAYTITGNFLNSAGFSVSGTGVVSATTVTTGVINFNTPVLFLNGPAAQGIEAGTVCAAGGFTLCSPPANGMYSEGGIAIGGIASGSTKIVSATSAASGSLTLPSATDTFALLAAAQTLSNKDIFPGTGTFSAGNAQIYTTAAAGMAISAGTGSTNDMTFASATGVSLIANPHGTNNLTFGVAAFSETYTFQGQFVTSTGTPTIASGACGTGTNGVVTSGDNQSGLITIGSAATTTCTISFSGTLGVAPKACLLTPQNAAAAAGATTLARVSSISATAWVITGSALANAAYYFHCF